MGFWKVEGPKFKNDCSRPIHVRAYPGSHAGSYRESGLFCVCDVCGLRLSAAQSPSGFLVLSLSSNLAKPSPSLLLGLNDDCSIYTWA